MKLYIKTILALLFISVATTSCEDVIDVDVQEDESRLVIEASLDWVKGTTGNEQTIKLSKSSAFFDVDGVKPVTGATVTVTNDTDGTVFEFEDQNNGDYLVTNFVPVLGQTYSLKVEAEGETYTATETLLPVADITGIYQDVTDGFDDETLELHITFNEPEDETNFYLLRFFKEGDTYPEFEVGDDYFVNGNELDWWYEIGEDDETEELEALQPGDNLNVKMYAISDAYYRYMEILINQIGGVGVFEATPVAVKGNCINTANPDKYAHGFFRLSEVNVIDYTFE